jgi:hypothetical protein
MTHLQPSIPANSRSVSGCSSSVSLDVSRMLGRHGYSIDTPLALIGASHFLISLTTKCAR